MKPESVDAYRGWSEACKTFAKAVNPDDFMGFDCEAGEWMFKAEPTSAVEDIPDEYEDVIGSLAHLAEKGCDVHIMVGDDRIKCTAIGYLGEFKAEAEAGDLHGALAALEEKVYLGLH